MFGSNRAFLNKIDELEQRSVGLARALDKTDKENKELKEIRLIAEHNNTVLVKKNQKQDAILKEIAKLSEINTYGNEKVILEKIRELVRDYQSKN